MPQKKTAFVVVDRHWFDLTMQPLVTGTPSNSQAGSHLLVGAVVDMADHRGLWLDKVTSDNIHAKDGSEVTMDLMIPWQYVLGIGVINDDAGQLPVGFQGATDLSSSKDES